MLHWMCNRGLLFCSIVVFMVSAHTVNHKHGFCIYWSSKPYEWMNIHCATRASRRRCASPFPLRSDADCWWINHGLISVTGGEVLCVHHATTEEVNNTTALPRKCPHNAHTPVDIHTNQHRHIHTHAHNHTHTHIDTHTHKHTHTYTCTHRHTRILMHTHTHLHPNAHTNTHTKTHTEKHTNRHSHWQCASVRQTAVVSFWSPGESDVRR